MIQWFVINVYPTALRTVVAAATGAIAAVLVIAPIKKGLHSMGKRLSAAIDSLDPDVPVGLTKQLDDMQTELQHIGTHLGGTLQVHVDKDRDDAALAHHGR